MKDITKIVKSFQESGLLVKGISETIKNWSKRTKRWISSNDIASLLGNALAGKGVIRTGEGVIRARPGFLIPPHPLANFKIQKYYQNESKFNGVHSRNNLYKIKDGAYIINLDEYE